jgi:uncharacterized protein YggU (UPF0235/DUF167 family)
MAAPTRLCCMGETSTRLRLRVAPGAGSAGIVGRYGDGWKVRVSAPPEGGRANEAVLRLLSDAVGVPRDSLRLVSGRGARDKVVVLEGVGPAQTERLLDSASSLGRPGRSTRRRGSERR